MIHGIVDALKSIRSTTCHNNLAISSLNCVRGFVLTLAEIDHRQNQLPNGSRKLESDVSSIYNYIDFLSNKIVTLNQIYPIELRTILNSIQNIIPKYLNFQSGPNINNSSFSDFLNVHQLIFNDTLIISIVVSL